MNVDVRKKLPLSCPTIGQREADYVMDCLQSTWISSVGEYVDRFEDAFAGVVGTKHAISCSNGTAALHLALLALGVKPGEEVIVPDLTFIACANSVIYCGANPILVDIDPEIWCLDPSKVEEQITSKTRGIIAVHLRGHPADMETIMAIAHRHGLFVIEDAAQAHCATLRGTPVGSIGEVGTFSFFGNKMITTGEGGMVTTNDDAIAERIRLLKNQGMTKDRRYWHPVVGYNYRLTNLQAAIGLAQVERLPEIAACHRQVAAWYQEELQGVSGLSWQQTRTWARHAWWQFVVVVEEELGEDRDAILARLNEKGIDARRLYYPTHQLPPYTGSAAGRKFPVAEHHAERGICLPTYAGMQRDDVEYVCECLLERRATR